MPYNSIPDRWESYSKCGEIVSGTSFLAFKVPLKASLCDKLDDPSLRFTIEDLLTHLSENRLRIGLVIDLTNTNRYYNPQDFLSNGVQHIKLSTPGHNVTPSEEVYQQFKYQVKQFEDINRDKNQVIGVHCTHGVNRTGYLICRYMIEELGMNLEEAIAAFKLARGHPIEKYTDELRSFRPQRSVPECNNGRTFQPVVAEPIAGHSRSKSSSRSRNNDSSHSRSNNSSQLGVKPAIKKKKHNNSHINQGNPTNHYHRDTRRQNHISNQFQEYFSNNYSHESHHYPPYHQNYSHIQYGYESNYPRQQQQQQYGADMRYSDYNDQQHYNSNRQKRRR